MLRKLIVTSDDYVLTVLRLVLGVVMFAHGAQKMLGWFGGNGFSGTMGAFTGMGMPAPLAFLVIVAEFFGSLGLILGFLGRLGGFGIAAVMLGAIALVHLPNGLFMNWAGTQRGEGFEYHLLALAIAAAVMWRGSGALSVDRVLTTRDESTAPSSRLRRAA